jgi:mono/diheme cytochrome c family protein
MGYVPARRKGKAMSSKPFAFLAAGAIAVLLASGCTKASDQSSSSSTTTTSTQAAASAAPVPTTSAAAAALGDASRGKVVFGTNCAACHGANGEGGGIGPTLKNEKSRKNFDQTVAQIENPQQPMPKLYPEPLNEQDVRDVAAFVETL